MKKCFNKVGLTCMVAALVATVNVQAASLEDASALLADMAANVVEAKFKLAKAANSGDVAASARAAEFGAQADSIMGRAMEAYAAMERAIQSGGNGDAEFRDIDASVEKVAELIGGKGAPAPQVAGRGKPVNKAPAAPQKRKQIDPNKDPLNPSAMPGKSGGAVGGGNGGAEGSSGDDEIVVVNELEKQGLDLDEAGGVIDDILGEGGGLDDGVVTPR